MSRKRAPCLKACYQSFKAQVWWLLVACGKSLDLSSQGRFLPSLTSWRWPRASSVGLAGHQLCGDQCARQQQGPRAREDWCLAQHRSWWPRQEDAAETGNTVRRQGDSRRGVTALRQLLLPVKQPRASGTASSSHSPAPASLGGSAGGGDCTDLFPSRESRALSLLARTRTRDALVATAEAPGGGGGAGPSCLAGLHALATVGSPARPKTQEGKSARRGAATAPGEAEPGQASRLLLLREGCSSPQAD